MACTAFSSWFQCRQFDARKGTWDYRGPALYGLIFNKFEKLLD